MQVPDINLLHEAGQVEQKLNDIHTVFGQVWNKERQCYQMMLLHPTKKEEFHEKLLQLSGKVQEMEQVLGDLKQTQKGNRHLCFT